MTPPRPLVADSKSLDRPDHSTRGVAYTVALPWRASQLLMGGLALAGCSGQVSDACRATVAGCVEPPDGGAGGASSGAASSAGGTASGDQGTGGTGGRNDPNAGGAATGGGTGGGLASLLKPCVPGIPPSPSVFRLTNWQYDNTIRDLLGLTRLSAHGDVPPSALLAADLSVPPSTYAQEGYQAAAEAIAEQVLSGELRANFVTCPIGAEGCYDEIIRDFGRKAYRRPLSADELALLQELTQATGQDPDDVPKALLVALLTSPSFLLRTESGGGPTADGSRKLNSYEIAARLSYLLWGSTPDADLDAAADADLLQTKPAILEQAQRMLEDAKAIPAGVQLLRDYAGMGPGTRWGAPDHDPEYFPDFPAQRPLAIEELDLFFGTLFSENAQFGDLFLSNLGFVNALTAPLYGVAPDAYGAELVPVYLDEETRPGFLTRIGFLSSFSDFRATGPIARGIYIACEILGLDFVPPDPGEPSLPPPVGDFLTERAYADALTAPAPCAACHAYLNPPGFALENYDAVGSWQTIDPRGGPIDPVASVFFGEEKVTIKSPYELMQGIASSASAQIAFVEKLVSSAAGRPENPQDTCLVNDLAEQVNAGSLGIKDLLLELTQVDSFHSIKPSP